MNQQEILDILVPKELPIGTGEGPYRFNGPYFNRDKVKISVPEEELEMLGEAIKVGLVEPSSIKMVEQLIDSRNESELTL